MSPRYLVGVLPILLGLSSAQASPPAKLAVVSSALELSLDVSSHDQFVFRMANVGKQSVRVVADARLLTLRLYDAKQRLLSTCQVPPALRPQNDVDNSLVIPPGRAYRESFDPRYYCFGHERNLRDGTYVAGTYGFPYVRGRAHLPPFVATAVDEPGRVRSVRDLPVRMSPLQARPSSRSVETPRGMTADSRAHLALRVPRRLDVSRAVDVSMRVELFNPGSRAATLLFSAETIAFDVVGPRGAFSCSWPTRPGAPNRHVYTTLAPGRKRHVHMTLSTPCDPMAFDEPGIYRLRPRLDTAHASGYSVGLYTYDGEVLDAGEVLMRVRHGRYATARSRPMLDPVTVP